MPVKKIIKAVLPGRAGDAPGGQTTKRVNLALQGGGAHGAFTWGVLEHLLSDDRLVIEGVSGTSSGAMNAIMLTDGLARGGRAEAQKRLAYFWRSVSSTGDLRRCSAPLWNGFCRLRRSKARRCKPGST